MPDVLDDCRGSGRTAAQLAALPAGGVYLVHSDKFAKYCRSLLSAAGRDPREIRFVTAGARTVDGIRFDHWAVDHAYWEFCGRRGSVVYELLSAAAVMAPA